MNLLAKSKYNSQIFWNKKRKLLGQNYFLKVNSTITHFQSCVPRISVYKSLSNKWQKAPMKVLSCIKNAKLQSDILMRNGRIWNFTLSRDQRSVFSNSLTTTSEFKKKITFDVSDFVIQNSITFSEEIGKERTYLQK